MVIKFFWPNDINHSTNCADKNIWLFDKVDFFLFIIYMLLNFKVFIYSRSPIILWSTDIHNALI